MKLLCRPLCFLLLMLTSPVRKTDGDGLFLGVALPDVMRHAPSHVILLLFSWLFRHWHRYSSGVIDALILLNTSDALPLKAGAAVLAIAFSVGLGFPNACSYRCANCIGVSPTVR